MKSSIVLLVAALASSCAASAADRTRPTITAIADVTAALRRPPPQITTPVLVVTRDPRPIRFDAGSRQAVEMQVDYRGSQGVLDISGALSAFAGPPVVTPLGNGRYRVRLETSDRLPAGIGRGTLTFRMCSVLPCLTHLPGARVDVQLRWDVRWVDIGDWGTFQRDAGHTGYVPVAIRPELIQRAWTWRRTNPGVADGINAVATGDGKVFVSEDSYFNAVATLHALDAGTGALVWKQDYLSYPALNPPAYADGRVFVTTTGHEKTFLWSFDAADGTPRSQSRFYGQWPHVLAPTVADGMVYTNGGYYGGGVYAYDIRDGMPLWSAFSGDDDMSTPAVRDGRLYFYDGHRLKVHDAVDGRTLATIEDPNATATAYSYHGAPILGPQDVYTFSGGAFSGRASSEVEHGASRNLVSFSLATNTLGWRSAKKYKTHPAYAEGVIYAAADDPKSFDAIEAATGRVLWSWVPGVNDTTFHRNVVVTKNLAFVSTNRALYAIDLATRRPVWTVPTPGMIAISGEGMLYIAEGATESNGRLHAYRIR